MKLRFYQREAVDDIQRRWKEGAVCVPSVLAVGLGKTIIFSTLIKEWLDENPGKRALVLAHTNELIEQAYRSVKRVIPNERIGIVKGARNNTSARVVISSRQTLALASRRSQLRAVGLVVIDECHRAVAANSYGKILRHFGALAPEDAASDWRASALAAGFTATLARGDRQKLSTVWEECSFKRDMLFGIRNGFLDDVRGERIVVADMNLKNVKTLGGDYSERSLADELERSFAVETIARDTLALASDRKGIAFWPLVATAEHAARAFNEVGLASAVVHGKMPERERKQVLADLRAGRISWVHNAMALTEGFDDDTIDCVLIGRNTKNRNLYIQMAGRGVRRNPLVPDSERRPALLIDTTGASDDCDLSMFVDLSPERSLAGTYSEHPDATLSELEEMYALAIEEEVSEQRAGASATFASDEYAGATTTRAFDPLGRSKAWGRTSAGTYYLKASVYGKADAFVFIVESLAGDPGTYDIVRCSTNTGYNPRYDARPEWAQGTEHVGLHLDMALSWGEELAGDAFNARKTSWRRGAPSEGQVRLARVFGVDPAGLTAGELSEAVDRARADKRIDAIVARVRASVQESTT